MTDGGPIFDGRLAVESPFGEFTMSLTESGTSIAPAGPTTILRALLWAASGRRRRVLRVVVDRIADVTGRPVLLRVAPGVRIHLAR